MSGRSPFTNDAIWKGAVETIGMSVKQSANKCGIGVDTARQMRRVLRGQMGITPKMKPPPEIVAQIPYADQQPLNPDVRATAAREVTAEANAASRINEVAPVITKKHKSRMTVENLIYIASNMQKFPREIGEVLGHSNNMIACWKKILSGELEPGARRLAQVSITEIRQIQADLRTVPTTLQSPGELTLTPESEQAIAESLASMTPQNIAAALQLTPRSEVSAIVDDLLALAERVEKLVPLIEDADEAIRKLAVLRTTLAE